MPMTGQDYTKLCEGFTPVAKFDVNGYAVGYGFHGPEIVAGTTMTQVQADIAFPSYYSVAVGGAQRAIGSLWHKLDYVRQCALVDMAYEMGGEALKKFNRMILAINQEEWDTAAEECLNSIGYGHSTSSGVRSRAIRASGMLLTGRWPVGFGG